MLDLLGVIACVVAVVGIIVILATVSDSDLRERNVLLAIIVGLILIAGGATTATLIFTRHADVDKATVNRIEATYGVTVNATGDFRTKRVSNWRIDGLYLRCYFTSKDMETADLRCQQKYSADEDIEFVTPDKLPAK